MDLNIVDNIFNRLIWAFYLKIIFYYKYTVLSIQNALRFKQNGDDEFRPKMLISNLMENLGNESNLINPNEPVEETFLKKIEEKDYDSAMKLAKKFDFDMNLIYQSMWKKHDASIQLIDECLTKITKPLWTLHECVDCVPSQLDILKHLLQFGIQNSSKEILDSYLEDIKNNCDDNYDDAALSIQEEKFVQLRKFLLIYLKRLNLYEKLLFQQHGDDYQTHFDSNYYKKFRNKSLFQLSIEFANKADCKWLEVIFENEFDVLAKHFLVILANLPETLKLVDHRNLMEEIFVKLLDKDIITNSNSNLSEDSTCELIFKEFEENFYKDNQCYLQYKIEFRLEKNVLENWFQNRARDIVEYTSLIDYSLQLLSYALKRGLSVKGLYKELDLYSLFLYDGFYDLISFEKFEKLSLYEKLNFGIEKKENIPIMVESTLEKFIEKLFFDYNEEISLKKRLLKEFLVKLTKVDFKQCAKIFQKYTMVNKTLNEIKLMKIIDDPCDLIELAIDCITNYDKPEYLPIALEIMECLPERSQACLLFEENDSLKLKSFNKISDRADQIEYYLSIIDVLQEYNTNYTVLDLCAEIKCRDKKQITSFLNKLITNFFKGLYTCDNCSIEWTNFFWNLKDLKKNCLDHISNEELISVAVRNLLSSANKQLIEISFKYINCDDVHQSDKKLSLNKGKEILKQTADEYIQFYSPSINDNLQYARMCYEFFEKNNLIDEEIKRELAFIEVLEILYKDFNIKLLPSKIKNMPLMDLFTSILSTDHKSYTKIILIMRISKLLNCSEQIEGQVLSLVGKEALKQQDHKTVVNMCNDIMNRNLNYSWDLCYQAAMDPEMANTIEINQKVALLSFALAYCPESDISIHYEILNIIRNIKTQHANMIKQHAFINFTGNDCNVICSN